MPGSTISVCNQPAEFEAALRHGGHVELLVTRHSRFRARLIRVAMPRASLLLTEESAPRIAFVSLAPGLVVVLVPLDRESSQVWAGIPSRVGEIITISGGQPVHARTEGSCRTGIICFAARDLARVAGALICPEFTVPAGVQRWQPAPSALRSLMRLHRAAIQVTVAHPAVPADADAARGLEQELASAVLECLSGQRVEADAAARQRHSALVVRMETLLRAYPDRPLSVSNVCATLGISPRTLQTCCQEHLGMPPRRYFRLRQLQRIHRALRVADPAKTCVSEVARRYGMMELGRFAGSYRDLFGELPSATIRRVASASPMGERRVPKQVGR